MEMKVFRRTAGYTVFDHKRKKNFGRAGSRTSWRDTKKVQIKLATKCNKNKKREDAKDYAELPLKRLLNEAETGLSRPDSWRMIMQKPKSGLGRFIFYVSRSHSPPAGLLWRSDQLVAEVATYTTHKKYKTPTTIPSAGFEFPIAAQAPTDIRLSTANVISLHLLLRTRNVTSDFILMND